MLYTYKCIFGIHNYNRYMYSNVHTYMIYMYIYIYMYVSIFYIHVHSSAVNYNAIFISGFNNNSSSEGFFVSLGY